MYLVVINIIPQIMSIYLNFYWTWNIPKQFSISCAAAACVESSGDCRCGCIRYHLHTEPLCAESFCATGAAAGRYTSVQENPLPSWRQYHQTTMTRLHWCYVYYGITYILALCSFLCYQRRALAQAFQRQQENVEVRIAAYQQLMHCPNQEIFTIVKTTLSNEKSSQGIKKYKLLVTQMCYIKSTLSQKVWNSNNYNMNR